MIKSVLLLIFISTCTTLYSNDGLLLDSITKEDSIVSDTTKRRSITAFPIAFFLPETSLGFGALGIVTFNIGKEKSWRPSQVGLSGAYTLKKQVLFFMPYELYYKQKWKSLGELGYFRYFFNYYGIGNQSKKENLEIYDANFPRFINNTSYRYTESNFIGIKTRFDGHQIQTPGTLLSSDNPIGVNGGNVFSLGLTHAIDTRNNIFYPKEGVFVNFESEFSTNKILSDFDFSLFQLSASTYKELKENHILALNLTTGTLVGGAPYFMYYYLSSPKVARGFADRRFIDKNILVGQAEYRFKIRNRIRAAVFGAVGNVANTYEDLFIVKPKASGGVGLRFQLNKKILNHVRVDVAGTQEGVQFYITFGEAF